MKKDGGIESADATTRQVERLHMLAVNVSKLNELSKHVNLASDSKTF